jgi:uncharacterized membrane protein YfhO
MKRQFVSTACTAAVSAFVVAAIWIFALFLFGFYPFGTRSILITDLGQQYIEYHAAFYDAVVKGNSLLYTWNTGLGMNFVGLFAYYLSSPFTFLIFLFSRSSITDAVLLIISAKIAVSALTFSIYLNRVVGVKGFLNITFSAMYALSAYSVVYCFNLMWLDSVILLPLVILALRYTISSCKTAPLTAVYALLFVSNFYTAYMVGVFSALYLITMLWIDGRTFIENKKIIIKFFKAVALAAGITAFITLPTAFALADSHGSLSKDWMFFGFMTDPLTLINKMTFVAYDSVTNAGTPFLYCGVLTLGLFPVWILHKGIPSKEKKGFVFLIGAMLVSMLFSLLDYLWHAAENPVWFPCRYSFVFIFLLLTCAARAVNTAEGLSRKKVIAGFVAASALILTSKLSEMIFSGLFNLVSASLTITLAALAVYSLITVLIISRSVKVRNISALLLVLVVSIELIANTAATFKNLDLELGFEERESYANYYKRGIAIRDAIDKADNLDSTPKNEFYRVENSNARNANDGMATGYRAVSHYSSFSRRETFSFLKSCGMYCMSDFKIFRYYGSASALDSVLGVKYVFSRNERRSGYIQTGISADGIPLWQNMNALPLVFFTDNKILEVKSSSSPFDTLNSLLNGFDYNNDYYDYYSPLEVNVELENCKLETENQKNLIKADETGTVNFIINNPVKQHVLLHLNNNFPEFKAVYLDGVQLNRHRERLIRSVIELGELDQGEHVVSLTVSGNNNWYSNLCAVSFDSLAFERLVSRLRETAPINFTVSSNKWGEPVLTGNFTAPHDGALFTSIPADSGWMVEIDGKKVKLDSVGDAFLALPVSKGEHSFMLHYRPRGLSAGLLISGFSIGLCVFLAIGKLIKSHLV